MRIAGRLIRLRVLSHSVLTPVIPAQAGIHPCLFR